MIETLLIVACMVIGYLVGTIPTGYLVARLRGVDIQKSGSGNIGATNVLRTLGLVPALIVVVMDPLKGLLATLFPQLIGLSPWGVALTGLATVLGNNFNLFLRLRGGKGIATSLGVFLAIDPWITLLAALIGILTMGLGRLVSLGSLVGLASAPLLLLASGDWVTAYLLLAFALALLAFYRHRENIGRLAAGTERRLGERVRKSPPATRK